MLWGLSFTNTWVLLTIIRDMITCFGVFSHTSTMPFHLHPCCTWKKFENFQVVHNRNLHPTLSFPKSSSMDSYPNTSMEDLSNTEVIHFEPHISIINDPWIFQWELIPPEIWRHYMHQKQSATIECLSSAIFAALTFSVSLPSFSASSSARTCLVRAFRQGLQRNLAQLLVFCISYKKSQVWKDLCVI